MTKPNLLSKRTWHDIGSDVNWIDYGGHWARRIDDTRYHVIRFDNLAEHTGDETAGYHVQLSEVSIDSPQLADALKCCGLEGWEDHTKLPLCQVEALASYGAYAPLWQAAGKNAHSLIRQAKAESRRLSASPEAYEQAMDRPVNAIGSTAREYAAGDMLSGVLRGVADGDPRAELMLKMGVR